MNYLVLGAGGMAGHVISIYLQEKGENVIGLARRKLSYVTTVVEDATNFQAVSRLLDNNNFDIIINCVGILNKSAEYNIDSAILINSYLPHFLEKKTANSGTRVFHMSTDCVFSGKTGQYTEQDIPDEITWYGRTKALGEVINDKDITFRTSIVGPDINENGIGLFNWFMKQEGSVHGYKKSIWSGVTTITLAKVMHEASANDKIHGLFHITNNQEISKNSLLEIFQQKTGKNIQIVPVDGVPYNKSLKNTRIDHTFRIPSYDEQVDEMVWWIKKHHELYNYIV